ncbi:tRNA lysidine(34) synthetase TilS [Aphanothece hegewaldii CCALA 016]|uniref:tRNA(Ile)-lysidine synthase n=1 Tax=Aphanothece hegewaldii CCALA 016 TaxID=2107694 RepID=A0A2T1LVV3_9CHRO|nr:tRNA lysidine(34) synthetase TilS [Aphanothece hegewaldii]PSF35989.1 tRNA lysidine(34) synthetase TilS [Aphanothece hegewaldii CCALA 016]
MWTNLHARLHTTLRQTKLITKTDKILIAVSGGQDSICLLKLLVDLQPKYNFKIAVGHCNHQWSTDLGIADFVGKIAQNWEIPFYLKIANNLKETEAAARKWRYEALQEIAQEQDFNIITTGHTKSDRAETLFYNLIRGAGVEGLSALNAKRELSPTVSLVRPLLNVSRTETEEFCQQLQLPVWDDQANHNLKYARNRIRTEVLPYLKTHFNPQVETTLAQTAEILQAESDFLETLTQNLASEIIELEQKRLNRIKLKNIHVALKRRIVKLFLEKNMLKSPNFSQIEAIINLIEAPQKSRTSSLPKNTQATVEGDWIILKTSD